jgi:NADH dehydrogenase (ubiquinone) Fe-S protein 4
MGRKTVDTHPETQVAHPTGLVPEQTEDVGVVTGVPDEHIKERVALIRAKINNCMQSGTFESNKWFIEFDQRERWENRLMSWESTGDPMADTNLEFATKDDAVIYCTRMGYKFEVDEKHGRKTGPKSYAENFSWNKKTRISTK